MNPAIYSLKIIVAGRRLEAVPWIGNVAFVGTMDVALGVAVLLKNGIGVAGMIFIAVLALIPLVEFLILAFLYQLVAALVEPVSDRRITTCISGVSSGYQLMVKVIASTTLLFVLSIALVVAVHSQGFRGERRNLPDAYTMDTKNHFNASRYECSSAGDSGKGL